MARFARRFRFLQLLRASLVAGALYDLGFGLLMVGAPRRLAEAFRLPLPPFFYLWLLATLLAMLAVAYLLAARDPRRYSGNLKLAIGGRLAGAAVLGLAAAGDPALSGLWLPAAGDLALALAHLGLWWPLRG
ncbi:MAG TPA: hypothetical protein VHM02_14120 [Thermoanaerobaculia bacterium]|nr:hypothetical protein [Thermoanaerobaculia bacterium]